MESALPMLVPILANQLLSTSSAIKSAATNALECIVRVVDSASLYQILSSIVQFGGNFKLKNVVLDTMSGKSSITTESIHFDYKAKTLGIPKYIIPCALKLLVEERAEVRKSNDRLLKIIFSQLGEELLDIGAKSAMGPNIRSKILKVVS